jgi:hypothetical protein
MSSEVCGMQAIIAPATIHIVYARGGSPAEYHGTARGIVQGSAWGV